MRSYVHPNVGSDAGGNRKMEMDVIWSDGGRNDLIETEMEKQIQRRVQTEEETDERNVEKRERERDDRKQLKRVREREREG